MPSGVRPVVSAASQFTFWIVAMLLLALGSWPTPSRNSFAASAFRCPGVPIRAAARAAVMKSRSSAAWARASSSVPMVM